MSNAHTVSEHGSFRLVEKDGRYAVVEARGGRVYGVQTDEGQRPSAPDRPDAVAKVVDPADWTDEAEARRLFEDVANRGETLARKIW